MVDFWGHSYNHMVMNQAKSPDLNAVFAALADPTRRAILARLMQGEATVQDLHEPFNISQPAISKHLKVLETAGLITRSQNRQSRPATLKAAPMREAVDWLTQFRRFWGVSFDQLDDLLRSMNDKGTPDD